MQILAKSLDQCEVNASFTSLKIPRPSRDGLFFCVFSFSHSIFEHFFRYLAALFWIFCEKSTKTRRKSMASLSKIHVFFAKAIVPWDNLHPEKTLTFQPFRCVFFAVGSLLVPNPRALLICQRCRIRLLLTCSPLFCPRLNVFFLHHHCLVLRLTQSTGGKSPCPGAPFSDRGSEKSRA